MKVLEFGLDINPAVVDIENTLEAMQGFVGGWIEVFPVFDDYVAILNEEGKLKDLPVTYSINGEKVAGNFFICKTEGCDFASIDEADVQKIMNYVKVW